MNVPGGVLVRETMVRDTGDFPEAALAAAVSVVFIPGATLVFRDVEEVLDEDPIEGDKEERIIRRTYQLDGRDPHSFGDAGWKVV